LFIYRVSIGCGWVRRESVENDAESCEFDGMMEGIVLLNVLRMVGSGILINSKGDDVVYVMRF
jgi:hypothetical protein